MGRESIPASFVSDLRYALQHLYNPDELRKSALGGLLGVDTARDPLALQSVLIEAIDTLKPRPGTPLQAPGWRLYRALYHRYAEQFSQAEVARTLSLSPRQLLRQEKVALRALAGYLWARYDVSAQPAGRDLSAQQALNGTAPSDSHLSRERELAWLRESLPSEAVDVGELVEAVLQTAHPVLASLAVQVEWAAPAESPPLLARRGPLRQALLHLLLAAARGAPGGAVRVEAEARGEKAHITLWAAPPQGSPPQAEADGEALTLARQLLTLSKGTVEALPADTFAVTVTLPAAGPATVLFIDDNADALLFFQRCLVGTRYLYAGTRDPQQATALAAELQPCAIVLDVMLPGIDGWELLGRLRANPDTRAVPVLICTILSEEQLALALSAAGFLRKPVRREALLRALDGLMRSG